MILKYDEYYVYVLDYLSNNGEKSGADIRSKVMDLAGVTPEERQLKSPKRHVYRQLPHLLGSAVLIPSWSAIKTFERHLQNFRFGNAIVEGPSRWFLRRCLAGNRRL